MLTRIQECYLSLTDFRNMRDRAKRYAYGRQWDDTVNVDGADMREADYIRAQGSVPLKNNLIRKLVRSVLGVFRNNYTFPDPAALGLDPDSDEEVTAYRRLTDLADANRLEEVFARTMEEFLISGMAIQRLTANITLPSLSGRSAAGLVRADYVSPDTFFFDSASRDFRGWDTTLIGEIHDVDFGTICSVFARSGEDVRRLAAIYSRPTAGGRYAGNNLCRVYEAWHLDTVPRYHIHDTERGTLCKMEADEFEALPAKQRKKLNATWFCDKVWRYSFLTPSGEVLAEGDSPFRDSGHPYVWRAYPFIDGEIHSFVDDVIDQQRFTNRLITLYDWALRSSAKGVLLFPQEAVPPGADINELVDEWSKFNGVILYRSKGTAQVPQQVSGGTAQSGITDLLNIQLKMFEDVSGVNSALQGRLESSNTRGTLYDSQMRQALVSLQDLLQTYNAFIRECLLKLLTLIRS